MELDKSEPVLVDVDASAFAMMRQRVAESRWLTPSLTVGVLIGAALLARLLIVRDVAAPWIMPDELLYTKMARSFVLPGINTPLGSPPYPSFYPALIAPAWRAGSMQTTYELAKMMNVVLMTSAAVPFYLWARRLAGGWHAVVGTVLFLTLPIFAYSYTLMSENAAFPLFMLSFFAIASALERPTVLRQLLAFAAIGLTSTMRLQALVLFLVLAAAIVCKALLDATSSATARRSRVFVAALRRYWLSLALLTAGALVYALVAVATRRSLSSGLGSYRGLTAWHYSIRDVARWSAYHAAELALALGVVPACALIVLLGLFRAASRTTAAERAYLAVTIPAVLLMLVQTGAYASSFSMRVEERYMLYLEPLLLLALVVWLARGLPRPTALVVVGVLVPTALLITLPLETLFTESLVTDTFGFVPFFTLTASIHGGIAGVRTLIGLGALGAGLLFAIVPRRVAWWAIPLAVGLFLGFSARSVFANEEFLANATRHAGGLSGDPSWIDHSVGRHSRVEFVYTTDISDPHIAWQAAFWNRSVRRVFDVTAQDPSIPDVPAPLDPATGTIVPDLPPGSPDSKPRFVVAASHVDVAGERIAQSGILSLYRVRPPVHLASAVEGLYPDGWTGGSATYTRYVAPARGSHLQVSVSRAGIAGPPPAKVQVAVGALQGPKGSPALGRVWAKKSWSLAAGTTHDFVLPLRPKAFRVQVTSPTFAPSQYVAGSTDTRELGVTVSFGVR